MLQLIAEAILGFLAECLMGIFWWLILFPVIWLVSLPFVLVLALFRRAPYRMAVANMLYCVHCFWREQGIWLTL